MVRLHGTVETVPYNQPSVRNCPIKFVDSLKGPVCLILSEQTGPFPRIFYITKKDHRDCGDLCGGEYRDRTGDLLHAMQALSQLS